MQDLEKPESAGEGVTGAPSSSAVAELGGELHNVALPPPTQVPKFINLVLEGGGVKGVALIGAVSALMHGLAEDPDYKHIRIAHYAGTSAGAIVAAFMGAGYTPAEIAQMAFETDFGAFVDTSWLSRVPVVGRPIDMAVGLLAKLGVFRGDGLLEFIRAKLRAKGIRTFRDLIVCGYDPQKDDLAHKYRVHMVASDITRGRMLVLPDDVTREFYGVDPDDLEVALAVRMSVSVPFLFRPVQLTGDNRVTSYIVDGGLLSNFPVWLFDTHGAGTGETSTIGVRILQDRYHDIKFPLLAARAAWAIASTALEARDVSDVSKAVDSLKWARVVEINTNAVPTFRFDLDMLHKEILYSAGYHVMARAIEANLLEKSGAVQRGADQAQENARLVGSPVGQLGFKAFPVTRRRRERPK